MFGPAATPVPPTLDCGSCKGGNIDVCVIQQHQWEQETRLVQDRYGRQALPQLFSLVKFPGPALLSAFHHAMFVLKVSDILLIWVKYKQNCTVCFPCHTIQLVSWEHRIAKFLWCGDAVSHGLDITFLMTIFSICLYKCFMAVLWGLFSLLLTAVTVEFPFFLCQKILYYCRLTVVCSISKEEISVEEALSCFCCGFSCFSGFSKGSCSELETTVNLINWKLNCVGNFRK